MATTINMPFAKNDRALDPGEGCWKEALVIRVLPKALQSSRASVIPRFYGSVKATSESPRVVPNFPCPPAAITTYCLPFSW